MDDGVGVSVNSSKDVQQGVGYTDELGRLYIIREGLTKDFYDESHTHLADVVFVDYTTGSVHRRASKRTDHPAVGDVLELSTRRAGERGLTKRSVSVGRAEVEDIVNGSFLYLGRSLKPSQVVGFARLRLLDSSVEFLGGARGSLAQKVVISPVADY